MEAKKQVEKDALGAELDAFKNQIESNYLALRKANNASRSNIEDRNKRDLLSLINDKDNEATKVRRRNLEKESRARKAGNITEDLLSISQMMVSANDSYTLGTHLLAFIF